MRQSELILYQQNKFNKLLITAYNNNNYYKTILTQIGFNELFDNSLSHIDKIPFLTKQIVREQGICKHNLWFGVDQRTTSGSTGMPLTFFKDRLATAYMEAVQNHAYSWHAIDVGDPQGRFWGLPTGKKQLIAKFKDLLKNRVRLSAFDTTDDSMFDFYKQLLKFSPRYFYGYPSLILEFARFLRREKLSLESVPLRLIIGTGELLYQREKDELQNLLSVKYAGEYGCSEIGVIGFDCPQGKMHVMSSNVIVEIVDASGNPVPAGVEGDIVVTELHARHFPFIRYCLGDRGKFDIESCSCGRSLPILNISGGRKDDYILTPDGRKVYDAILAYTLKKGIVKFQATQDGYNHLTVSVVVDSLYNDEVELQYIAELKNKISNDINIDFIKVADIEREPSGKLRYFKQTVN
ncbi:adenylyltransferase [Geotalea uraniireducens]|uniref:Adenylyltransferase n=1 Tax=Geotalea uraniireducens TaxID=351604 RepID=A0ABM8EKV2_9BACT|nr:adenylyltransferase [Geotalea uraniireducens]